MAPNTSNQELGIYKIPLDCEPIILTLNKKGTLEKKDLQHKELVSLGILAKKTGHLKLLESRLVSMGTIHVLHRSRKKLTIKIPIATTKTTLATKNNHAFLVETTFNNATQLD